MNLERVLKKNISCASDIIFCVLKGFQQIKKKEKKEKGKCFQGRGKKRSQGSEVLRSVDACEWQSVPGGSENTARGGNLRRDAVKPDFIPLNFRNAAQEK